MSKFKIKNIAHLRKHIQLKKYINASHSKIDTLFKKKSILKAVLNIY